MYSPLERRSFKEYTYIHSIDIIRDVYDLYVGTDFDLLEKEVIFSNQNSVFEVKEVRLMLYNDGMKESPEGFRIILDAPEGTEYQQRDISVVIDDN